MQFTFRNPARSTNPTCTLANVRSLVVGAHAYPSTMPGRPEGAYGRVARYAVEDEYGGLRAGLDAVAARLRRDGFATRVVADDNALVDRAVAHRAAIGWFGKNANLLVPGAGSWFVLGSVLTDADLPAAEAPVADGCGGCTRCLEGCPTGAIVAPGVVDASRCLAWLVQAEGDFPEELRAALGDRIYGCDDCQEVCPPNRLTRRPAEHADRDVSPRAWVSLIELLRATDDELLARHGLWYIPRRDPRFLRRNALVALGNVAEGDDAEVARVVRDYVRGDDELLRRHAKWAADRLGLAT
jgi:epoxyqueuosine reductase